MAKKRDDIDLDDNFGMDDFGAMDDGGEGGWEGPSADGKGKRAPVTSLKGSFVEGVKQGVMDPSVQMKFVRAALPPGYNQTIDTVDAVTSGARELYDEAVKEAGPVIKDLKKLTRKHLLPGLGGYLPKSWNEKIEAWSAEEEVRSREEFDPEEHEISMTLGTMFQAQQEAIQKMEEERQNRENAIEERRTASDKMAQVQTDASIKTLAQIQMNTGRLSNYQDQVTINFQRKSLELQYRTYFVNRKLLNVMEQHLELSKSSFETLVHNSGLPDLLKSHNHEKMVEVLKLKYLGEVTEPMSKWFAGIGKKIITKGKTDIKEFFQGFSSNISQVLSGADDFVQEQADNAEMGIETKTMGGMGAEIIGSMAADKGAELAGKLLRSSDFIGFKNTRLGQWLERTGLMLARKHRDAITDYQSFLEDGQNAEGLKGKAARWLSEATGKYSESDKVIGDSSGEMDSRALWTLQNSRTLNEIIPGWLSKIHYAIESGNAQRGASFDSKTMTKANLAIKALGGQSHFSFESNQFETEDDLMKRMKKVLDKTDDYKAIGEILTRMVNTIDPYYDLPDDCREVMRAHLLDRIGVQKTSYGIETWLEEAGENFPQVLRGPKGFTPRQRTNNDDEESMGADGPWVKKISDTVKASLRFNDKLKWKDDAPDPKYFKGTKGVQVFLRESQLTRLSLLAQELRNRIGNNKEALLKFQKLGFGHTEALRKNNYLTREYEEYEDAQGNKRKRVKIDSFDWNENTEIRNKAIMSHSNDNEDLETKAEQKYERAFERYEEDLRLYQNQQADGTLPPGATAPVEPPKPPHMRARGGIIPDEGVSYFNDGGKAKARRTFKPREGEIRGAGTGTSDEIPAMLSNGEYVVRADATRQPGVLPLLRYLNSLGDKGNQFAPTGNYGVGENGMDGEALLTMSDKLEVQLIDVNKKLEEIKGKPFIGINLADLASLDIDPTKLKEMLGSFKIGNLSFVDELILGTKNKVVGAADWTWDKAKWGVGKSWDMTAGAGKFAWGGVNKGFKAGKKVFNDWLEDARDIYVRGSQEVRIRAEDIRQRILYDVNTNKVIESIKDITGEVRRLDTNELVLSAEDFRKRLTDQKLKPMLDWVGKKFTQIKDFALSPFRLVKNIAKHVVNILDMPDDIYVKGSDPWVPRMFAYMFRAKKYRDAKTEKVIEYVSDIQGAVLLDMGEGKAPQMVITDEEFTGGKLCDIEGNPIKGIRERMYNTIKAAAKVPLTLAKKGWELTKEAGEWIWEKLGGGWDHLKSYFDGTASIQIGLFTTQTATVTRLEQIWMLLNNRLPGERETLPPDFGKIAQLKLPDLGDKFDKAEAWFEQKKLKATMKGELAKAKALAKAEEYKAKAEEAKAKAMLKYEQIRQKKDSKLAELHGKYGDKIPSFWKRVLGMGRSAVTGNADDDAYQNYLSGNARNEGSDTSGRRLDGFEGAKRSIGNLFGKMKSGLSNAKDNVGFYAWCRKKGIHGFQSQEEYELTKRVYLQETGGKSEEPAYEEQRPDLLHIQTFEAWLSNKNIAAGTDEYSLDKLTPEQKEKLHVEYLAERSGWINENAKRSRNATAANYLNKMKNFSMKGLDSAKGAGHLIKATMSRELARAKDGYSEAEMAAKAKLAAKLDQIQPKSFDDWLKAKNDITLDVLRASPLYLQKQYAEDYDKYCTDFMKRKLTILEHGNKAKREMKEAMDKAKSVADKVRGAFSEENINSAKGYWEKMKTKEGRESLKLEGKQKLMDKLMNPSAKPFPEWLQEYGISGNDYDKLSPSDQKLMQVQYEVHIQHLRTGREELIASIKSTRDKVKVALGFSPAVYTFPEFLEKTGTAEEYEIYKTVNPDKAKEIKDIFDNYLIGKPTAVAWYKKKAIAKNMAEAAAKAKRTKDKLLSLFSRKKEGAPGEFVGPMPEMVGPMPEIAKTGFEKVKDKMLKFFENRSAGKMTRGEYFAQNNVNWDTLTMDEQVIWEGKYQRAMYAAKKEDKLRARGELKAKFVDLKNGFIAKFNGLKKLRNLFRSGYEGPSLEEWVEEKGGNWAEMDEDERKHAEAAYDAHVKEVKARGKVSLKDKLSGVKGKLKGMFSRQPGESWADRVKRVFKRKRDLDADSDNDGIRDGSAEDQKKKGLWNRMRDGLAGTGKAGTTLAERFMTKDGITTWMKSFAMSIAGVMGAVGSGIWTITKAAGALMNPLNWIKAGGMAVRGAAAVVGTAGKAVGAVAKATWGVAKFAMRNAGGVALRAVAMLTNPVTLAVGATAFAGYLGYKWLKKKFQDNAVLFRFRMEQYGFKHDDEENVGKIVAMEKKLSSVVRTGQGGVAELSSGIKGEELMTIWGIDMEDSKEVERWCVWFVGRFKPIYLSHCTMAMAMQKTFSLEKIDDLDSKESLKYLKAVHYTGDGKRPYDVMASPVAGGDTVDIAGDAWMSHSVDNYYDDAEEWIKDHAEDMDLEKAALTDPKKKKELEEKKAQTWQAKTEAAWNALTHPVDTLSKWGEKLGQTETAGAVSNFLTKATDVAAGTLEAAKYNIKAGIATGMKMVSGTSKEARTQNFYSVMRAAAAAGDPHPEIVAAQWALESSWGKKESGKFNYFGIKAVGSQPGTNVPTHEVENGRRVSVMAKFRDYSSLEEGIAGRVGFIAKNKRYRKFGYYDATTPMQAARSLLAATYATDPNYPMALGKILLSMGINPNDRSGSALANTPGGIPAPTNAALAASVAADSNSSTPKGIPASTTAQTAAATKGAAKTSPTVAAASANAAKLSTTAKGTTAPIASPPTTAQTAKAAVAEEKAKPLVATASKSIYEGDDNVDPKLIKANDTGYKEAAANTDDYSKPAAGKITFADDNNGYDIIAQQNKEKEAAAAAALEKARSDALGNTSQGMDAAVMLMKEQLKVQINMDATLTKIEKCLSEMAKNGGKSSSTPQPTSTPQPSARVASATPPTESGRPPVSMARAS